MMNHKVCTATSNSLTTSANRRAIVTLHIQISPNLLLQGHIEIEDEVSPKVHRNPSYPVTSHQPPVIPRLPFPVNVPPMPCRFPGIPRHFPSVPVDLRPIGIHTALCWILLFS